MAKFNKIKFKLYTEGWIYVLPLPPPPISNMDTYCNGRSRPFFLIFFILKNSKIIPINRMETMSWCVYPFCKRNPVLINLRYPPAIHNWKLNLILIFSFNKNKMSISNPLRSFSMTSSLILITFTHDLLCYNVH